MPTGLYFVLTYFSFLPYTLLRVMLVYSDTIYSISFMTQPRSTVFGTINIINHEPLLSLSASISPWPSSDWKLRISKASKQYHLSAQYTLIISSLFFITQIQHYQQTLTQEFDQQHFTRQSDLEIRFTIPAIGNRVNFCCSSYTDPAVSRIPVST